MRLVATNPVRIAQYGVYAPALVVGDITPQTADAPASADALLVASVEVENYGASPLAGARVALAVLDAAGATVAAATTAARDVVAGDNATTTLFAANLSLPAASLWSVEHPTLYTLRATLVATVGATALDAVDATFGARRTAWSADDGFFLNGVPTKILGACNHMDFAGVGVAIPDALQAHRVAKLQAMGGNGWRTSHNAPTPALLDCTDAMGMLV